MKALDNSINSKSLTQLGLSHFSEAKAECSESGGDGQSSCILTPYYNTDLTRHGQ
jgi:hypothetical protein